MNKIIAIVLAIVTCVCAASCVICVASVSNGNSSGDAKIIGRWNFEDVNYFMTFNEDHTGRMAKIDNEEDGGPFRWSYDADADVYAIYMDGKAYVYYGKLDADGNWVYNGKTGTKK